MNKLFLELNHKGEIQNNQDKAIYLKQNQIVRIFLRNSKQGFQPFLILQKEYKRIHDMQDQTIKQISQNHTIKQFILDTSGDWKLDIEFNITGSAYLRLCWQSAIDQKLQLGVENHLIVQPLFIDKLQEITIQTLLPYCLGKFENYQQQIQSQVDLGYEAFHFPPIQQLGKSPSLYAIADQLKLNTDIFDNHTYEELKQLFNAFPNTYFFIDILLNHTAFDSSWLTQPEFINATYNIHNSPHLQVAIQLDCAIAEFSNKLGTGLLAQYPKNTIYNENDLDQIINILEHEYIRRLNIHQYFQFNIEQVLKEIHQRCPKIVEHKQQQFEENQNIFIKSPCEIIFQMLEQETTLKGYKKNGVSLNFNVISDFLNKDKNYCKVSLEYIEEVLQYYNHKYYEEAESYIKEAVNCTKGQIRWWKLTLKNPLVEVNDKGDSLVPRYFTQLSNGIYVANNGWIQGFDPLNNFAENQDHHYLRRTIVIWGDLVKLRYGHKKQDSPSLWKYMKKYVQQMSHLFAGLRLDNAHSTPMVVGEYMMRKARKANPNILVFAELFTGSPLIDSIFTKRMGINCLVRETNRCSDSGHLNRDLHYYSGDGRMSIGSLPKLQESFEKLNEKFTILQPQYSPALIYEQSHDNESLISTFGYKHQLPIAALISFSNCMGGTVRGYDIYLPKRLSVVDERRLYPLTKPIEDVQIERTPLITFRHDGQINQYVEVVGSWNQWSQGIQLQHSQNGVYFTTIDLPIGQYEYKYRVNGNWANEKNNILQIEQNMVKTHSTMELVRLKLHQIKKELNRDFPYIFCQNHSDTIQSITRESQDRTKSKLLITVPNFAQPNQFISIKLPGKLIKVDAIFYHDDFIQYPEINDENILPSKVAIIQHTNIREFAEIINDHILFTKLPQSFTAIMEFQISDEQQLQLKYLDNIFNSQQIDIFKKLSSQQINYLLYMSEPEERDKNNKGLYFVPNYRQLIYAGFAGPRSATREAQTTNNLAHPICENLRNGNWLIDYLNDRLVNQLDQVSQLVNQISQHLKQIPRHHIPSYFCKLVDFIYNNCVIAITDNQSSQFKRELQLASYQFLADLPSSKQMAAGLPHFTTGWARCWGRDTFISFKGIYLENGLFEDAKQAILIFGSCIRHGLIPNLLDSGNNPRFNCRDACWWYIKAVKDYIHYVNSSDILKEEVQMKFLDDDIDKHYHLKNQGVIIKKNIADVIQQIFQNHATGIKFREWRAGSQIDTNMQSEGFNIQLALDEQTGFIVGGNWLNCLTWMDKMGSAEVNRGIPATSRDGAPIELTALLKVCLDFAITHQYPYDGVVCPNGKKLLFKEWHHYLIQNFEKYYYIPKQHDPNYQEYQIIEKHVRHRQIYKDLVKSSKPRNEYQLRCNANIAIGLAPELFNKEKAKFHLASVEANLMRENSIGLKTLDPAASEYVHFYDNSDQSHIFNVSHGFSYHNGPEWVWVYGYFLKALLAIHGKQTVTKELFYSYLSNHKSVLHQNEWYSLPEMTNGNGEYNLFSCRAQAWSIACILEAINDCE